MRRLVPALAIGLAAVLLPARADAHLVTTGLGPVYDGVGHLLASPEDLVPAIALALYAGLRGASGGRRALLLLPLAWLAGGLIGLCAPVTFPFPIGAISFMVFGVLVATDLVLPGGAVAALAVALGLAFGFENGSALAVAGGGARNLIGIAAALFVVVALVSAFVVALERPWKRIAVRVAGSWIAAVGLLLIGWSLRGAR